MGEIPFAVSMHHQNAVHFPTIRGHIQVAVMIEVGDGNIVWEVPCGKWGTWGLSEIPFPTG
jgi:hypothetical protein